MISLNVGDSTATIKIVSVYADYKHKYNVQVIESHDVKGIRRKKFGLYEYGEEFRCTIDYQNITLYCPAKENVAIDQKFDEMWEKL